jgi:hypothetical protein
MWEVRGTPLQSYDMGLPYLTAGFYAIYNMVCSASRTLVRLRNHCYDRSEIIRSVYIVKPRHCRQYQKSCTKIHMRRTHVALYKNTSKTSLGVNVSVRYFCPNLIKFGSLSTDFQEKSSVSNFTEIRPMGAALIDEANRSFSRLCESA